MQNLMVVVKNIEETKCIDSALDKMYDDIDDFLLEGKFDEVDLLLKSTITVDYSVTLLLGLLTITLAAHSKLPSREDFFDRVESDFVSRGEDPDSLLFGLREREIMSEDQKHIYKKTKLCGCGKDWAKFQCEMCLVKICKDCLEEREGVDGEEGG